MKKSRSLRRRSSLKNDKERIGRKIGGKLFLMKSNKKWKKLIVLKKMRKPTGSKDTKGSRNTKGSKKRREKKFKNSLMSRIKMNKKIRINRITRMTRSKTNRIITIKIRQQPVQLLFIKIQVKTSKSIRTSTAGPTTLTLTVGFINICQSIAKFTKMVKICPILTNIWMIINTLRKSTKIYRMDTKVSVRGLMAIATPTPMVITSLEFTRETKGISPSTFLINKKKKLKRGKNLISMLPILINGHIILPITCHPNPRQWFQDSRLQLKWINQALQR